MPDDELRGVDIPSIVFFAERKCGGIFELALQAIDTVRALRSNEPIHLVVRAPEPVSGKSGLSGREAWLSCLGLVYAGREDRLLARAEARLAPLAALAGSGA